MVVLRVKLQHGVYELWFALARAELINNSVSVVPDLVVLEVLECGWVEPCDFVFQ
jgi:hypothetical protein